MGDGSWPLLMYEKSGFPMGCSSSPWNNCMPKTDDTPYNILHPTWVITQALRDRNFELSRPGNVKWTEKIRKLMKQVHFDTIEFKIKYAPVARRRSKIRPKEREEKEKAEKSGCEAPKEKERREDVPSREKKSEKKDTSAKEKKKDEAAKKEKELRRSLSRRK